MLFRSTPPSPSPASVAVGSSVPAAGAGVATSVSAFPGSGASAVGSGFPQAARVPPARARSEERRVGKECRSRWSPYH